MITHDYKLIFIHIPKCGGRGINEVFNQRFDHFTAYHYYREYQCYWNEYEIFSIIRNPFARLVSMYTFIQNLRDVKQMPVKLNGAEFKPWVIRNLMRNTGFFDIESPEANWAYDWEVGSKFWFSPQYRFLGAGAFKEKIRIFRMEEGFNKIEEWFMSRKIKNPQGNEPRIPHRNGSVHKDYRTFYDNELVDYLKEHPFIKTDMDAYNYDFV